MDQVAPPCVEVSEIQLGDDSAVSPGGHGSDLSRAPSSPSPASSDDPELGGGGAKPQRLRRDGEWHEVWSEHWGLSVAQCRELMARCRREPTWDAKHTVYTLVKDYIKPWTRGTGLGYAVLVNQEAPKEVSVMMSHAWGENAEEFFDALTRSLHDEEVVFICALSLYQCEDGAGPSIGEQIGSVAEESPFRRVLTHIAKIGNASGWLWRHRARLTMLKRFLLMLAIVCFFYPMGAANCIPALGGTCAFGEVLNEGESKWARGATCMLPVWRFHYKTMPAYLLPFLPLAILCLASAIVLHMVLSSRWFSYNGRMVVMPNRECDIYSRLWCCYEIFGAVKLDVPISLAKTLAAAGRSSVRAAACSSAADMERILGEIESWHVASGKSLTDLVDIMSRSTSNLFSHPSSDGTTGGFGQLEHGGGLDRGAKRAYHRIDQAIRQTTRKANRAAALTAVQWILPFLMMSLALPEGDWANRDFDENGDFVVRQMFGTSVCTGIYSMALAGITLIAFVFVVGKRYSGSFSLKAAWMLTGGCALLGLGMRLLDRLLLAGYEHVLSPTNYAPFHHCFTLALSSGGIGLVAIVALEVLTGGRFITWRRRECCLALAGPAVLALLVAGAATAPTVDQIYPVAVWYLSFRFAPFFGFPAFLWCAAATWGVQIEDLTKKSF